ncbi:MAG: CarD family transcriptional regulator [Bilophila wadsworthia]
MESACERFACVHAEPLVMGIAKGIHDLPERSLSSFEDLFPSTAEQDRPWQTLVQALKRWQNDKRQTILCFASEKSRTKFLNLASQDGLSPLLRYSGEQHGLFALVAPFRAGAELIWDQSLILGEDLLQPHAEKSRRVPTGAFKGLDRYDELKPGDLLVHRDYGIARFGGLLRMETGSTANDFLLLHYSGDDRLYVPVDRLSLIQRFKGGGEAQPSLDRLGGGAWQTGKEKARKAIEKIAEDLIEMYAWRKVAKGFRYPPLGELYREFEASFGFEETPDQAKAIQDVLADMEKPEPMDRLVCGDVGSAKRRLLCGRRSEPPRKGVRSHSCVPTVLPSSITRPSAPAFGLCSMSDC